jgi:hypothetical protein
MNPAPQNWKAARRLQARRLKQQDWSQRQTAEALGVSEGAVSSLAGIALILPMLGVETHTLPIIGTLYLAGQTGIAPAVGLIYHGPALMVFLVGLVLLAARAITFAVTIWHSEALPRWAGVLFAIGLGLWFPRFHG